MNELRRNTSPEGQFGLDLGVEATSRPPKPMPATRIGRASRRRKSKRAELPYPVERMKQRPGIRLENIEPPDPAENLGANPSAVTEETQFFDNDNRNIAGNSAA